MPEGRPVKCPYGLNGFGVRKDFAGMIHVPLRHVKEEAMRKFRKSEILLLDEATGQVRVLEAYDYELAFFTKWLQPAVGSWFRAMGWTSPDVVPAVKIVPTKPPTPEGEWGELIRGNGYAPAAIAYVGANPTRKVFIFRRSLDGA